MWIEGKCHDDMNYSYLIVSENSKLPFELSILQERAIYSHNFSFKSDDSIYYAWIFALESATESIITEPLYKTVDRLTNNARCLILEWKYPTEYFGVYSLGSDGVLHGADESYGEIYREVFLNAFGKDVCADYCMKDVHSWFNKAFGLSESTTKCLISELDKKGVEVF